jgi:hypothetical protein
MDVSKILAELKAEGYIVEHEKEWPRIHPGVMEPPQGTPPATGGAAQVACIVDRRGPVKKPAHVD